MKKILLLMILSLGACSREEVRVYRAPKESVSANPLQAPPAQAGLHWQAPEGWKEKPASGMRLASFEAATTSGNADISVVMLPGDAGGDLANVNRWRSQVGLGSWDEKGLKANAARIKAPAGDIVFVDFTGKAEGTETRLLAGIFVKDGQTWFFKAMGMEKAVAGVKPAFIKFLESVHEAH